MEKRNEHPDYGEFAKLAENGKKSAVKQKVAKLNADRQDLTVLKAMLTQKLNNNLTDVKRTEVTAQLKTADTDISALEARIAFGKQLAEDLPDEVSMFGVLQSAMGNRRRQGYVSDEESEDSNDFD